MKKIWKYQLTSRDCILQLPKDAEILTVKLQNEIPTLWALVDPNTFELEERYVCTIGTGWDAEDNTVMI
jgi:hypothetical protein